MVHQKNTHGKAVKLQDLYGKLTKRDRRGGKSEKEEL